MKESTSRHFGLIVAYVLPGFLGLAGLAPIFPMIAEWLRPVNQGDLGLGPPLYALTGAEVEEGAARFVGAVFRKVRDSGP